MAVNEDVGIRYHRSDRAREWQISKCPAWPATGASGKPGGGEPGDGVPDWRWHAAFILAVFAIPFNKRRGNGFKLCWRQPQGRKSISL
jgi:hypothetical protein